MQTSFLKFHEQLQENSIKINYPRLNKMIKEYSFCFISDESDINKIDDNIKKSEIIIIDQYTGINDQDNYFIFGINKALLLIRKSSISILQKFCQSNSNIPIYFLSGSKDTFEKSIKVQNKMYESDPLFLEEIICFNQKIIINTKTKNFHAIEIWRIINKCFSGYLIQSSYHKLIQDQKKESYKKENHPIIKNMRNDEYIELGIHGAGSSFIIELIYHIERNCIYCIKKPNGNNLEIEKLLKREIANYSILNSPYIPKFHGTINDRNLQYPVIQFINGHTLKNIDKLQLSFEEKAKIIVEIAVAIKYIQFKGFVYRDLKPDNIMIDENNNVFIIDFDRMIKYKNDLKDEKYTVDFSSVFVAPEINKGIVTYQSDLYSIGQMIYYIFCEKYPNYQNIINESSLIEIDQKLSTIYKMCTQEDLIKRSDILTVTLAIYLALSSFIKFETVQSDNDLLYMLGCRSNADEIISINFPKSVEFLEFGLMFNDKYSQFAYGHIYFSGKYIIHNIQKAIHYFQLSADQGLDIAQYYLGTIYYEGKCVSQDIQKAIHYYTLAADQNYSSAQLNLGVIYSSNKFNMIDMDKAIHYFELASEQNNEVASYNLGEIYLNGHHVNRDINKAIHYYLLASNLNYASSHKVLGCLYHDGLYVKQDMDKAIHYFTLASNLNESQSQYYLSIIYENMHDFKKSFSYLTLSADNNFVEAQYILGSKYYEGIEINQDINKAIKYLKMASNQNHIKAQHCLGLIYYNKCVPQDINKAIYYFTLSANQGDLKSQKCLGFIYLQSEKTKENIDKSIYYFKLASDQNDPSVQIMLALIYLEGKYCLPDIEKAIHYYKLAASQNKVEALFALGYIYYTNEYVPKDIQQSIYYLTLASNLNHIQSQYELGMIFYNDKDIPCDIIKSIYYFTLAADNNHIKAQYNLGIIFLEGKKTTKDINKSIHYLTLAANQNYLNAQLALGLIYYNNDYIPIDNDKSFYYLTLAANQNSSIAQYALGNIYANRKFHKYDINKAIHFYNLSGKQNNSDALFNLGHIYIDGIDIVRDINRAIHFFKLSADLGNEYAQLNLGCFFYDGKYVKRDINKSIHYMELSANQGNNIAQYNLGKIYFEHIYVKFDINKVVYYMTLSATQKNDKAQFLLGVLYHGYNNYLPVDLGKSIDYLTRAANQNNNMAQYYIGIIYVNFSDKKNILKGVDFLIQSANNGNIESNLIVGYLYHVGKHVDKDIQKALHYYKESSSFNNIYAKNNLGILYKNGNKSKKSENFIAPNIDLAIEYFQESIRKGNDKVSMYNLSHIYIYEFHKKELIDQSINLLTQSIEQNFEPSCKLLIIALVQKYKFNINKISEELIKLNLKNFHIVIDVNLLNDDDFSRFFNYYKTIDFIYDPNHQAIESKEIEYMYFNEHEKSFKKSLTKYFYEGFGTQ